MTGSESGCRQGPRQKQIEAKPGRDAAIAEKVRAFAGQGTPQEDAALILDVSLDEIETTYAGDWATGTAVGGAKIQQAIFESSVGRPAQIDPQTKQVIRAEVQPKPSTAAILQKRRDQIQRTADLSKLHPELRPIGAILASPKTKKMGRPKFSGKFTKALGEEICRRIAEGDFLTGICAEAGMPAVPTIEAWASDEEQYPDFCMAFARARDLQVEGMMRRARSLLEEVQPVFRRTVRDTPDGVVVEIREESDLDLRKAQADLEVKMAARIDAGRHRRELFAHQREMRLMVAELAGPYGGGEESLLDENSGGPTKILVQIVGGTPKGPVCDPDESLRITDGRG